MQWIVLYPTREPEDEEHDGNHQTPADPPPKVLSTFNEAPAGLLNDLGSVGDSAKETLGELTALKDKLTVIVDQLKAKGADVSSYLAALKAE